MKTNLKKSLLALWVAFMIGLTACGSTSQVEPPSTSVEPITQSQTETAETTASDQTVSTDSSSYSTDISDLPVYSGEPYVPINDNIPAFSDSDFTTTSFEHYSELDSLGRCGVAFLESLSRQLSRLLPATSLICKVSVRQTAGNPFWMNASTCFAQAHTCHIHSS